MFFKGKLISYMWVSSDFLQFLSTNSIDLFSSGEWDFLLSFSMKSALKTLLNLFLMSSISLTLALKQRFDEDIFLRGPLMSHPILCIVRKKNVFFFQSVFFFSETTFFHKFCFSSVFFFIKGVFQQLCLLQGIYIILTISSIYKFIFIMSVKKQMCKCSSSYR